MKNNFCIVNYNTITNKWNVILETALIKDYLEFNSKTKAIKEAKMIAFNKKTLLYIYDKRNNLELKYNFI